MRTLATAEDFNRYLDSGFLMQLIREGVADAVAKKRALGLMPAAQGSLNDAPVLAKKIRSAPKKSRALATVRKRAAA